MTGQHRSGGVTTTTRPDHGRTIRLDIEGMRTIAVGSVLITGLLAREVSR